MYDLFPFVLGVVFVGINGLTQLVFAQTQGFKLKPASIGLMIAAGFNLVFGLITPITGQSAMIALAGKLQETRQRTAALLFAATLMTLLGLTGTISVALEYAGPAIIAGMMAGVGLMLTEIGVEFISHKEKGNLGVGVVSFVSALVIFAISTTAGSAHALVYTVAGSVTISTIYYLLSQKPTLSEIRGESDASKFWTLSYWKQDDWKLVKPHFTFKSILSGLALICLGVGITTSFGAINAGMAGGLEQNFDQLTLVSGLAGFFSVIFGGMPLETIISGTAAAPWPVLGSVAVMLILALLLLLGLVTKLCKYIPTQSIAGFLMIIGIFSTFLPQLRNDGFASDMPVAGVTMAVTALTKNPFLGVLAGLAVRYLGIFVGLG